MVANFRGPEFTKVQWLHNFLKVTQPDATAAGIFNSVSELNCLCQSAAPLWLTTQKIWTLRLGDKAIIAGVAQHRCRTIEEAWPLKQNSREVEDVVTRQGRP